MSNLSNGSTTYASDASNETSTTTSDVGSSNGSTKRQSQRFSGVDDSGFVSRQNISNDSHVSSTSTPNSGSSSTTMGSSSTLNSGSSLTVSVIFLLIFFCVISSVQIKLLQGEKKTLSCSTHYI